MEPEDATELGKPQGKTRKDKELFLMEEQRKQFLAMKSAPDKCAVKTIDMTTKDLKYCINLVDKAAAVLRGLTPILKEVLWWVKCCK